jgi:hypothetical protein
MKDTIFNEFIVSNDVDKVKEIINENPNIVNDMILDKQGYGNINIIWYFLIDYVNEILYDDESKNRIVMLELLLENCSDLNKNLKIKSHGKKRSLLDFIFMYYDNKKHNILIDIMIILLKYDIEYSRKNDEKLVEEINVKLFLQFIESNNIEKVKEIIKKDKNIINTKIDNGERITNVAWYFFLDFFNEILSDNSYQDRIEILELLITNCSDVNTKININDHYITFLDFIFASDKSSTDVNRIGEEKYNAIVNIASILLKSKVQYTYIRNKELLLAAKRLLNKQSRNF